MQARITQAFAVLLIAAVASTAFAAPKEKKDAAKGAKGKDPSAKILKGVTLTAEQQEKVTKIVAEHKDALTKAKAAKDKAAMKSAVKELHAALIGVLTDEQKAELEKAKAEKKPKGEKKPKAKGAKKDA